MADQDDTIGKLRRDLTSASAKLSDTRGDLTERKKRELERCKQLVIEQQHELAECRSRLVKLSDIVEKQARQIAALNADLAKSRQETSGLAHKATESATTIGELKLKLSDAESRAKHVDTSRREESKIANELTAVGEQCRGERHEQIIVRQREALNELRTRVKLLEQTSPHTSTHQQQLQQQVMLLKKQLAEVRANQALSEDIAKQAELARGNDQTFLMIEEKTAHYETQTALEASEESVRLLSCRYD